MPAAARDPMSHPIINAGIFFILMFTSSPRLRLKWQPISQITRSSNRRKRPNGYSCHQRNSRSRRLRRLSLQTPFEISCCEGCPEGQTCPPSETMEANLYFGSTQNPDTQLRSRHSMFKIQVLGLIPIHPPPAGLARERHRWALTNRSGHNDRSNVDANSFSPLALL